MSVQAVSVQAVSVIQWCASSGDLFTSPPIFQAVEKTSHHLVFATAHNLVN